jgi:hypothetical protein
LTWCLLCSRTRWISTCWTGYGRHRGNRCPDSTG